MALWKICLYIGDLWNHWLWVMIIGRVCSCMFVGMNMGERFLVRMFNNSQEVLDKDAWETLP